MENQEWEMENKNVGMGNVGKRIGNVGMRNGEWEMDYEDCRNGEWEMGNSNRKIENRKFKIVNNTSEMKFFH